MSDSINEALINELEEQIKSLEKRLQEEKRKRDEKSGRPDYSWLKENKEVFIIPKPVEVEISEYSRILSVDSVCKIIRELRDLVVNQNSKADLLKCFMSLLETYAASKHVCIDINDSYIKKDHTSKVNEFQKRSSSEPSIRGVIKKTGKVHPFESTL